MPYVQTGSKSDGTFREWFEPLPADTPPRFIIQHALLLFEEVAMQSGGSGRALKMADQALAELEATGYEIRRRVVR